MRVKFGLVVCEVFVWNVVLSVSFNTMDVENNGDSTNWISHTL